MFSVYEGGVSLLEVKHRNVNDLSSAEFQILLNDKEYRSFIEFLLMENKKGENGLLFKNILENCSKTEEEFVKKEIEKMNELVNDVNVWKKPAKEKYIGFKKEYQRSFKQTEDESMVIKLFILMTLNYVFVSYKEPHFRKFLGVKKRGLFSKPKTSA
jgi:hypothetical protein